MKETHTNYNRKSGRPTHSSWIASRRGRRPPNVLLFGPGIDYADNGYDIFAKFIRHEELAQIDTRGQAAIAANRPAKLKALQRIAAEQVASGEARPGDFVVVCSSQRHNGSFEGCVIGADGVPVRADSAFASVHQDDVATRMVIPSRLVPADLDPIQLFAPLFAFTDVNSPVMVCLPDGSELLRSLGIAPLEGHVCVLSAHDGECSEDLRNINLCDGGDRFFFINRVSRFDATTGWDYQSAPSPEELLCASYDGLQWFHRRKNA